MSTPYLAEIAIFSFHFPPKGWAKCNGQLLPIGDNQPLFSLLGSSFGGDGRTNFALPDMRTNVTDDLTGNPAYKNLENSGMAYYIALQGTFPSQ